MAKLEVFDFDGTLVDTPVDTAANRALYLEATGIPWVIDRKLSKKLTEKLGRPIGMRKGWFGRPETLEPPLVPDPTPSEMFKKEVVEAFRKSKVDQDAITLVMTGRHLGLKHHVLRILKDGRLVETFHYQNNGKSCYEVADADVQVWLLGDQGPFPVGVQPRETLPWKLWMLQQYLDHYSVITEVEIWEDRKKHVAAFEEWGETIKQKLTVHFVD